MCREILQLLVGQITKQYFLKNALAYSFSLENIKTYFKLYMDLIKFWEYQYGDRIYKINYEKLTIDQESETKSLIALLDLKWERLVYSHKKTFEV